MCELKARRTPLVPNEETNEAIEAARRGELTTVRSVEELFASLNVDDNR